MLGRVIWLICFTQRPPISNHLQRHIFMSDQVPGSATLTHTLSIPRLDAEKC